MSPLDLVKLTPLMERTSGSLETKVGLIDGPVDLGQNDLAVDHIQEIPGKLRGRCARADSVACQHGTFVAGILFGKRGTVAPAICPGCSLLLRPIFTEEAAASGGMPSATPQELAAAILDCIEAGARIINLSLAVIRASSKGERELVESLDQARRRGVLVVAAAGNQGIVGSSVITRHPWVIPVAACDPQGRPNSQSNFARSLGRNGLLAPGEDITSLGTAGKPVTYGGTSVAAPFVSGTIALLWSEFPAASAGEIKSALMQVRLHRQTTVVPALLDAETGYQQLTTKVGNGRNGMNQSEEVGQPVDRSVLTNDPPPSAPVPSIKGVPAIAPQSGGGNCSCGGGGNANGANVTYSYVYALGQIQPRFPTPAVEKEFAQATGRAATTGLTDRQALQSVLTKQGNRYLVRQLCWVLSTGGVETYILQPRDPGDFQLLAETVRPAPRPTDVDVVIGTRGPIASPQTCNGLLVPIVYFDQIYSFDVDALIKGIPRPEKISAEKFAPMAEEVFFRTLQIADNAGATDEHRALNYLAVRYDALYAKAADCFGRNCALTAVDVRPSPLSSARKLVDVILSFTHRENDVTEKFSVRVDVSEQFPFLVTKLAPYYDR
jgi:hypothetical protein